MAKMSVLIMPRESMEKAGMGEKRPIELRRNRTTSSCVSQQNSWPLWKVVVVHFGCCFLLELLLSLVLIGTTKFWTPRRIRSMAASRLKDTEHRVRVSIGLCETELK